MLGTSNAGSGKGQELVGLLTQPSLGDVGPERHEPKSAPGSTLGACDGNIRELLVLMPSSTALEVMG